MHHIRIHVPSEANSAGVDAADHVEPDPLPLPEQRRLRSIQQGRTRFVPRHLAGGMGLESAQAYMRGARRHHKRFGGELLSEVGGGFDAD